MDAVLAYDFVCEGSISGHSTGVGRLTRVGIWGLIWRSAGLSRLVFLYVRV